MWKEVVIWGFYSRAWLEKSVRPFLAAGTSVPSVSVTVTCQILSFSFFFRRNVVGEAYQSVRQLTFIFLYSHSYHTYLEHLGKSHANGSFLNKVQLKVKELELNNVSLTIFLSKKHSHKPNHTFPKEGNNRLIRMLFKPQISPIDLADNFFFKNQQGCHTILKKIMVNSLPYTSTSDSCTLP